MRFPLKRLSPAPGGSNLSVPSGMQDGIAEGLFQGFHGDFAVPADAAVHAVVAVGEVDHRVIQVDERAVQFDTGLRCTVGHNHSHRRIASVGGRVVEQIGARCGNRCTVVPHRVPFGQAVVDDG